MLEIKIVNTLKNSKRPEFGDYEYKIFSAGRLISVGEVKNHDRSKGWKQLLKDIAEHGVEEFSKPRVGI